MADWWGSLDGQTKAAMLSAIAAIISLTKVERFGGNEIRFAPDQGYCSPSHQARA